MLFFNLPDLVIDLILNNYLSYEDLITLKLVSKRMKDLLDCKNFKKIHLSIHGHPYNRVLFYTNEFASYSNSFSEIQDLKILESSKFKNQFNQLMQLTIDHCCSAYLRLNLDLNCLNYFNKLIHLEINKVDKIKGKLNLNDLKICSVGSLLKSRFELDCPELKALKISLRSRPKLIKTKNLTYLWTKSIFYGKELDEESYLIDLIKNCKNVTTFICDFIPTLKRFIIDENNNQLNLPSINELRLDCFEEYNSNLNLLMNSLIDLKENSTTKHIKLFINDELLQLNELIRIKNLLIEFNLGSLPSPHHLKGDFFDFIIPNLILNCLILIVRNDNECQKLAFQLISKLQYENILPLVSRSNLKKDFYRLDDNLFQFIIKKFKNKYGQTYLTNFIDLNENQMGSLLNYYPFLSSFNFQMYNPNLNLNLIYKFKNITHLTLSFSIERDLLNDLFKNCLFLAVITLNGYHQTIQFSKYNYNYQSKLFEIKIRNRFNNHELKMVRFDDLNLALDYYYEIDNI